MKKFLSLVLALVMTMSLVTVSAGATEYKDFTDKDEIQYAEAVTVLNKLGIITGYSEGDFRPEGELTRGAAAKILVSLLIGPDAAAALGNETSPYPDVPAGNTFAGVISYCKTAKIINGYGDGTFRPQGTLTGYAFAKMLLGAVGYKSEHEGFTGAGWNMNVARLGGEAGLFDRISFNGNATVTREQACQLALNTLKATMVEYSGGMNITNGEQAVVVNPERNYKTSNQEFATHISNRKAGGNVPVAGDALYTVEFGEEHFVDLRMVTERTADDVFGRPSNEWSWKKVTIGTFPIEPDFVFTSQVSHKDATDAAKNRATGLSGYDVYTGKNATILYVNGSRNPSVTGVSALAKTADIADLTDNGTVVEVYIDDQVADRIDTVVVIKSQLMEVRRVGSDYVSLQKEGNKKADDLNTAAEAYNLAPIDVVVENVQTEDDAYSTLSALKAGDLVVVAPVADDFDSGSPKWKVGDAYVPETVNGALTAVDTYGKSGQNGKNAVAVTVGGTSYKISLWARDLYDVNADEVKITRGDVTLYLDRYGYAMKSKDIGDVSDWFIVGRYYDTLVNNRIVTMAEGWDTNGNKMELNLGTSYSKKDTYRPGDLVRYTNSTSSNADWTLSDSQVTLVDSTKYDEIKTSDVYIPLKGEADDYQKTDVNMYVDKGIKFIYVTFDQDSKEVESIEIKNGVQNVKNTELAKSFNSGKAAQAGYSIKNNADKTAKEPDAVKVVVIKQESNDAIATNMLYVRTQKGGGVKDANGNMIYCYTVDMMTADGLEEEITIYSDDKINENSFAAYTAKEHADYSSFYDLRSHNNYTGRTTSTFQATLAGVSANNKYLLRVNNFDAVKGSNKDSEPFAKNDVMVAKDPRDLTTAGGEAYTIDIARAEFVDLRSAEELTLTRDQRVNSRDDFYQFMVDYLNKSTANDTTSAKILGVDDYNWTLQLIINDNDTSSGFRSVAMVVITSQSGKLTAEPSFPNVGGGEPGGESSEKDVTLTINGSTKSWKNGENISLDSAVASAVTTITLTPSEGATITSTISSDGTVSPNKQSVTVSGVSNNTTVVVEVKAADGTSDRYTFVFTVINKTQWTNTFVTDLMARYNVATTKNGYTIGDWENVTKSGAGPKVDSDGETIVAPILNTGVEEDITTQFIAAMNELVKDKAIPSDRFDESKVFVNNGTWYAPYTVGGMTFSYKFTPSATGKGLAWVKADPDATAAPVIFTIGTDDIDDVVKSPDAISAVVGIVDDDGTPVASASVGTTKAVPGHTYTNEAWNVLVQAQQDVTVTPKGSGATWDSGVTVTPDAADLAAGKIVVDTNDYYLKPGAKVTATLKVATAPAGTETLTMTAPGTSCGYTPGATVSVPATAAAGDEFTVTWTAPDPAQDAVDPDFTVTAS